MPESAGDLLQAVSAALSALGFRDILLGLVLVLALYVLVLVLRVSALANRGRQAPVDELSSARYESDLHGDRSPRRKADLDQFYASPLPADSPPSAEAAKPKRPIKGEIRGEPFVTPEVESATVASLEKERIQRLERDLQALRNEFDALRSAFAAFRDATQAELEQLRSLQEVSPIYGDPMKMARAGRSAEEIAARCQISRAEAELVRSLAGGASAEPAGAESSEISPRVPRSMTERAAASAGRGASTHQGRYGSY